MLKSGHLWTSTFICIIVRSILSNFHVFSPASTRNTGISHCVWRSRGIKHAMASQEKQNICLPSRCALCLAHNNTGLTASCRFSWASAIKGTRGINRGNRAHSQPRDLHLVCGWAIERFVNTGKFANAILRL